MILDLTQVFQLVMLATVTGLVVCLVVIVSKEDKEKRITATGDI